MSGEIKLEVIKKTQSSLGKYVTKPPLTEKLLRKPPFRFLHDIISAVIKETGFLEGLFSQEELNSDFKDKEAKIAYLTKLINVVKLITGIELTVRPVKIVCGQEPTKTNQLLQVIANALDKNISSVEAVEHYKKNEEKIVERTPKSNSPLHKQLKMGHEQHSVHGRKVAEPNDKDHKSTRTSHVGVTVRQQPETHNETIKNNRGLSTKKIRSIKNVKMDVQTTVSSKDSMNMSMVDDIQGGRSKVSEVESTQLSKTKSSDSVEAQFGETSKSTSPPEVESENIMSQNDGGDDFTRDVSPRATECNPGPVISDKSPRTDKNMSPLQDVEILGNASDSPKPSVSEQSVSMSKYSLRPPSGRPSSARPAAPKLRWKPEITIQSNELVLMENDLVILDNFDSHDDDRDSMVVIQADTNGHVASIDDNKNTNSDVIQEHGYLVAQILQTQRELAKITTVDHIPHKIDKELEVGSTRVNENTIQEVDKLRVKIQTLTRATNPMGNLLDFWQEDVEIMQNELFEWRNQFREQNNHLKIEKTSSTVWAKEREESLSEIKANINDQHNKIYQMKLNIVKNNHKIQQLLDGRA